MLYIGLVIGAVIVVPMSKSRYSFRGVSVDLFGFFLDRTLVLIIYLLQAISTPSLATRFQLDISTSCSTVMPSTSAVPATQLAPSVIVSSAVNVRSSFAFFLPVWV